jgi:transcriptional regulator with XRE-family HTH domain
VGSFQRSGAAHRCHHRLASELAVQLRPLKATAVPQRHIGYLGEAIKRARRGRFTIDELAQRSGVSTGLISQIEKGRGNPSFVTLLKLASALDVTLGAFFNSQPLHRESDVVVRKGGRRKLVLEQEGLVYEILSSDAYQTLRVVRFQLPPGFDNRERPFSHPGQECVFLLAGRLEAHLGSSVFGLEEGDAITYDSTTPHWWRNPGQEPTVLIRSATPPPF